MRAVVMRQMMKSVVLLGAVALVPASALAQAGEEAETAADNYELRRLAGHVLYAYDLPAEAFIVLEDLGDQALAAGDASGAIQAYYDAAWIAGEEATELNRKFNPTIVGVGAEQRPKSAREAARRVFTKAKNAGGSDSPQLAALKIDPAMTGYEMRLDAGLVLNAVGQLDFAIMILEKLGDDSLAQGDNAGAGLAYREALYIAHAGDMRRRVTYDPKQIGIAQVGEGFKNIANRLVDKVREAEGSN